MVKYTYLEAEAIDSMFDEQMTLKDIAEQINKDFHQNNPARSERSVRYVIDKIYKEDDGWLEKLEQKWLEQCK